MTPQEQSARENVHRLSRREQEVLDLLSHGMTNREIASDLLISPDTVKDHVRAVRSKLGARTRVHAAQIAWLARDTTVRNAA
ncbi:response regulator transcription factor [Streptomyces sp. NPDC056468]|uniref:response regulator transcription factor n=1 Tax=Streptomyces sp. NPDC056468 TaxID=3345830 RepID=UPI0036C556C9